MQNYILKHKEIVTQKEFWESLIAYLKQNVVTLPLYLKEVSGDIYKWENITDDLTSIEFFLMTASVSEIEKYLELVYQLDDPVIGNTEYRFFLILSAGNLFSKYGDELKKCDIFKLTFLTSLYVFCTKDDIEKSAQIIENPSYYDEVINSYENNVEIFEELSLLKKQMELRYQKRLQS